MLRLLIAALALLAPLLVGGPARAATTDAARENRSCYIMTRIDGWPQPVCIHEKTFDEDVCRAIEIFAKRWDLPEAFFARLIWQESKFNPNAASWAGAQGIAQFIPSTARIRGLQNAFDPAEALARSAEYLRFLEDKYGSLGLAAGAYNAGEGAMSRIVGGGSYIPAETRGYVQIITGRPIELWLKTAWLPADYDLSKDVSFQEACLDMAKARPMPKLEVQTARWQPWGVLLGQDFSPEVARKMFERSRKLYGSLMGKEEALILRVRNPSFGNKLRYSAMVGKDSRGEADTLCNKIRAAGGSCIVVKNRPN